MAETDKTKDLEKELKTAFKEERFEDVRKLASEIKDADPDNHFVDRIVEKMEDAETKKLRKANSGKIKDLEKQLKGAFKDGLLAEVRKLSEEIKKLDPKNKMVNKIEKRIEKAKASIEADAKKEKIKALKAEIRDLMKEEQLDKAVESANKLLTADWENSFAIKILKKAAKEKNVEYETLITAKPAKETTEEVKPKTLSISEEKPAVTPVLPIEKKETKSEVKQVIEEKKPAEAKTEEKPGFFARLFGKKAEAPAEKAEKMPKEKEKPELETKKEVEAPKEVMPPAAVKPAVTPKPVAVTPAQLFAPKPEVIKPGAPSPTPVEKTPVAPAAAPKPVVKPGTFSPSKPLETTSVKPAEVAPVKPVSAAPPKPAEVKPVISAPAVPPAVAAPKPEVKPETPKAAAEEKPAKGAEPAGSAEEKGNIFTRLFGRKQAEKTPESIIETIVEQSGKPKPKVAKKPVKPVKKEEGLGENYLKFANYFLKFTVVFIALSAIFFYVFNIDEQNRALGALGKENYAIRLKNAADELEKKKVEEKAINKDIDYYEQGYQNEFEGTINKIIENRMNWSSLIRKLNEVTESVYEKNALAKYVEYNNYSYDVTTGQLRVNGTLSDPLGKNLTKLAELEEAFIYYPKDKNNPEDERKPYFFNVQEFKSYAKKLDQTTGRFTSNFSLSLYTKEPAKK